jgi:hypothetical protein
LHVGIKLLFEGNMGPASNVHLLQQSGAPKTAINVWATRPRYIYTIRKSTIKIYRLNRLKKTEKNWHGTQCQCCSRLVVDYLL